MHKKLIAGNWKMNGSLGGAVSLASAVCEALQARDAAFFDAVETVICPPFVHILTVQSILSRQPQNAIPAIGAQDCAVTDNGAHTGDVSAQMIADLDCGYVILGHSERRKNHHEASALVAAKAAKAHEAGLVAIICVGETIEERTAGQAQSVVKEQLEQSIPPSATAKNTVIAYEPVWAIGTGNTAKPSDVLEMHSFIHEFLRPRLEHSDSLRIIYGGSVNPENAAELMALRHVDGALIGGASLKAESFMAIADSCLLR